MQIQLEEISAGPLGRVGSYDQEVWSEVALLLGVLEDIVNERAQLDEPRALGEDPPRLRAMLFLTRAITELPEQERFVVVLYYLRNQSIKEIGQQLQVSESDTTKLRMCGIAWLRKSLASD